MFVNSESAVNAAEILDVLISRLEEQTKLSALDQSILESIRDVKIELEPKPYKPYGSISEAVSNYVELRDMLGLDRKAWEDHEKDVKSEMEKISMYLRDRGDELGVDSFNTPYGTAYRNIKESFRIESWDSYAAWLLKTGNLQCLEKRPAKLAVREIFEESGELPPGLIQYVEVEFNVRRPTKKSS